MEKNHVWDMEELEANDKLGEQSGLGAEGGLELGCELESESGSVEGSATADPLVDCKAVIEGAIGRAAGDCGAPFESEVLHALVALRDRNFPEWMRVRARFKKANKDISPPQLDLAVDFHANLTHHFHLDLTHPGS